MQSHYEINVSLHGRHLFATAERSCVTEAQAREVYAELSRRFSPAEGFEISVTFADCVHRTINPARLLPEPRRPIKATKLPSLVKPFMP
jgi:hypothetical protein